MSKIVTSKFVGYHYQKCMVIVLLVSFLAVDSEAQSNRFEAGIAAKNRGRYQTAFRSWLPLAEAGMAEAQLNIGSLYQNGQGVNTDYAEAMRWYQQAASNGLPQAQVNIGILYFLGLGVDQNFTESINWFELASEQGLAAGTFMLGNAHYNGYGIKKDLVKARALFLSAAKSGYAEAQFSYALVALSGAGALAKRDSFFSRRKAGEGDPFAAYIWARLAYTNGYRTDDTIQIYEVAEIAIKSRLDEAERWIALCIESNYENCVDAD